MTRTKKDDLKAIISPLIYQNFLALGTTLELVAEITAGNTAETSVEARNNASTAPTACDGHAC